MIFNYGWGNYHAGIQPANYELCLLIFNFRSKKICFSSNCLKLLYFKIKLVTDVSSDRRVVDDKI